MKTAKLPFFIPLSLSLSKKKKMIDHYYFKSFSDTILQSDMSGYVNFIYIIYMFH